MNKSPNHGNPLMQKLQKAHALMSSGDHKRAEKILKQLRRDAPKWPDPIRLSGMNVLYGGRANIAVKFFKQLILLCPHSHDALSLLGTAFMECNQFDKAQESYENALKLNPQNVGLYNNLGSAFRKLKKLDKAESAYRAGLAIGPNDPATRLNLANVLHHMKKYSEAESIYKELLCENLDDDSAYVNLASTLLCQKKILEAIQVCDQGLTKFGNSTNLLFSKGHLLGVSGNLKGSERLLTKLLDIEPNNVRGLQALSIHYFLQGRWLEAWSAYQSRFLTGTVERRPFKSPIWKGESLLGKSILIWGEQGVGDEIMFASMLPDLIKLGGKVSYETEKRLHPLFERSFPSVTFHVKSNPPEKKLSKTRFNFQSPSGNLGIWFRKSEADFPNYRSFLQADKAMTKRLRAKYKRDDRPVIGVSWRSNNPDIGKEKSVHLKDLCPVLKLPNINFIDLQYGDTTKERDTLYKDEGIKLFNDEEINQLISLDGFAAQVAAMDQVISISNTAVHMAGALGVPVWVILQSVPDRRWMINRSDSPWYKGVKLFRQETNGNWDTVIINIVKELNSCYPQNIR